MAHIAFASVGKTYPDGTVALDDFTLDVPDGEFMVLVGPSGCGKTTALRMLAGLEEITTGTIAIDGETVNDVEPQDRDIAMVFQNYALYPHMSVRENLAFGLETRRVPKAEVKRRVEDVGRTLGLSELLARKPKALSGGQRQRVAMGRAIVREPKAFLMDEPLSNLDAKLRVQMRAEISRLQRDLGVTTLYVTHDQTEALTMADRVAVLRGGHLQQIGTAREVYEHPRNLFVAGFIGSPAMNIFRTTVVDERGALACLVGKQRLVLPHDVETRIPALRERLGTDVALGIRPEHLGRLPAHGLTAPGLKAVVRLIEMMGFEQLVHLELDASPVVTDETLDAVRDIDAVVEANLVRQVGLQSLGVVARFSHDVQLTPGETVELTPDLGHIHFFDLATNQLLPSRPMKPTETRAQLSQSIAESRTALW